MVSNGGFFLIFFFNFQEHLEAFVQILTGFTIAFVLLWNHCPFYLSLPERQLQLEHYVSGSNIFKTNIFQKLRTSLVSGILNEAGQKFAAREG